MIDNWQIKNENNKIKEYFKSKGFTEDYFIERGISELNCSGKFITIEELENKGISTEHLREIIPKILFEKYATSIQDIELSGLHCVILRDLGILAPEQGVDPLRYTIAEASTNLISNEERDALSFTSKWHYDEDTIVHIKKYCHPILRKWVEFAEGALVGRGFYDSTGKWIQYSKLDQQEREYYSARFESGTVPPITFRLVNGPDGSEVLRAMNPPYFRQKLPDDLADKFRFSIPTHVVERMQLSDKLKKVLSFSYASTREIRVRIFLFPFLFVNRSFFCLSSFLFLFPFSLLPSSSLFPFHHLSCSSFLFPSFHFLPWTLFYSSLKGFPIFYASNKCWILKKCLI